MTTRDAHHPLPSDPRARPDRLPESIADARDGDDAPAAPEIAPPDHLYRDPDGRPYPA
ncbi:MAG: hypothetical protein JO290_08325 [Sphingomonadaceae bacterium]|nr:hypothetical protein [Sphingomonadaceae bacterium]